MEVTTIIYLFFIPVSIIMIFCGYRIFRGDWGIAGGVVHPAQPAESNADDPEALEKEKKQRLQILEQIFPSQSSTSLSSTDEEDVESTRALIYDDETKRYEWQPKTDTNVTSKECSICLEDFGSACEIVTPVCSHSYHRSCIMNWITKNHNTCPTCRNSMWDTKEYNRLSDELKETQVEESLP
mmetsp:Transcript_32730/g.48468  ORF Transcript_32730/g.48468 Transcript_32730/m.48468 type:complete len:183 (+) Transcript_32730:112-660(+)|eukprot:CAMPEP_0194212812 /NCGR_PEP_ID=MMETSP0156-20130528/12910_1 /TAXON_ID=33649 /ORGANISM="Thalassionema nitzschioides, Strain L26-B" /LENGTH=182 /DNA_ID=CAMNT_0038940695 /DNA_START=60 /DNA_END=608 /DNA_ORIENTATION=+